MSTYIDSIKSAIIVFPLIALVISLPFMIWAYRKYGSFSFLRALILYSFSFYLLTAYFMVILPLPSFDTVASMTSPIMELSPFSFVTNYLKSRSTLALLEPIFNVFLLVPLGVYLRYYFQFSFKKTVLFSFLLSLFFELTQLTALYGIYPRPYRVFSTDDLILNTVGGIVGFVIAPLFMKILPNREKLDRRSYEKGQCVSLLRRGVAFIIDGVICLIIMGITSYIIIKVGISTSGLGQDMFAILPYMITIVIYFMIVSYLSKGKTAGKAIVRIRVVRNDGTDRDPSLWDLIKRYVLLYYFMVPLYILLAYLLQISGTVSNYQLQFVFGEIVFVFLLCIIFVFNFVYALFSKSHKLIYETLSGTKVISTITE